MTTEERIEALEKEIARLKDIDQIKALKSRYFRALDTKDWDALEQTLSPDISTSYSNGKLVFHGPKEVTEYFKEVMPATEITLHQGHNPEITLESDTVAWGKWYLQDILARRKPASLKLATLLDKPSRRVHPEVVVDYCGFTIEDKFVVGYGLDYDQYYRNLNYIGYVIFDEE